ncbi:glycosyltransferase family 4 protein [Kitasatospora mediocidica]|uniref:glycosyltransferase family 4 protein n=1 Tax=Kitasatospora mediocidica TaxID=58352 RepID=UPI0018DB014E|nr:glycosyltransferase family 4 protein [Kitasatospora mediocidica]
MERVVLTLANAIAERGREVHVVVLEPVGMSAMITELHEDVRLHVLTGGQRSRLAQLRRLTRHGIVHLHLAEGVLPAVRWALRGNPAVFVSYHSDYGPVRGPAKNLLDRVITRRSHGVIAVSEAVRDFCVDQVRLPPDLVTVIENAVPEPADGGVRVDRTGALTLVALATVNPHKNYPGLIEGFALARRRGHAVRLRIIGDGPRLAEAFDTAQRLSVNGDIEWYGSLWQASVVNALLGSSDVFVSASRNEGLPMSVLEGLQHGLPMILSDIAPHREAAGEAAVYFDSEVPEQFAARVEELMERDARQRRAESARGRAARFAASAFVDRHLDLYGSFPSTTSEDSR